MIAIAFLGRHWKLIGGVIGAALVIWAVLSHFAGDRRTEAALAKLGAEAKTFVVKVREASGNPQVEWSTAGGQIVALGESNRALKASVEFQNQRIDDLARQAVKARARAAELKAIADRAQAQKASALRRLSEMAVTPGTRADCMVLIREADAALNLVREASE